MGAPLGKAAAADPEKVPLKSVQFIEQSYPYDIGTSAVAIECKGMRNFLNKKLPLDFQA